jgi:transposase-like protein
MFVPTATSANRNFRAECQEHWRVNNIRPTTAVRPLSEQEWFVLDRSKSLYRYMEEVAFLEGLCTIQCFRAPGKGATYQMHASGVEADHALMMIQAILLSSPVSYFLSATREFTERVMTKLKIQYESEGQKSFSSSLDVLVQFSGDCALCVTAVGPTEASQRELIASVFDKIDFWTTQEGYNDFNKNEDEGVLCANGHFFCSVEGCLDSAISSQIFHIRSREEWVICPVCKAPYDVARVAARVKNATLINVLKAVIDKSVEKERAALEETFDRQLKAKTLELFEKYANADETLKVKAKQAALDIRNTILNLSCPHCGIAYAEFIGCMALQCESCEKNFCAYCHFKAGTSRGAHEHVRECLMNESTNGSYFADPVQIKNAQRRYRQRELKKHIRKFKKDEQNAIVIELSNDLKDLDIDPSGLFEVGNLQPVVEEDPP